ncbi:ATP-binding protein [Desulfobacula sp.]|uniref:ATP-binding protein n=1 Tax=Desulfobacula sp. TaxID=2593537 RepID=UPI00262366CC|nr:ATP-binding protein [Desulfobacula sp.]
MKLAKESKTFIIVILTIGIALFHLTGSETHMGTHMIHRELFFFPIILSCFWFGLKPGLITVGIVSLLYVSQAFFGTETQLLLVPTLFHLITFLLVAIILGVLVNQNEKIHEENIRKKELAALGNAALNIGIEIQDVLVALKKSGCQSKVDSPEKDEIEKGFNRLDKLVKVLTSFDTPTDRHGLNFNINQVIAEQISALKEKAHLAGIKIETILDKKECLSKVSEESIVKLIKDLIVNAIEASSRGRKILIRTRHMSTYNIVEVEDEGEGIKPEHLKKIFHPFFTTKEYGHGLSLASDYKFIQSCGGDMAVSSNFGKGTIFKVKIPIDDPSKPINGMNKISDWNPRENKQAVED